MSAMFGKIADKPFSHRGRYGTLFQADRCDLRGGVRIVVNRNADLTPEQFVADVAMCAAYHAALILPDLNGFPGYDTVKYEIIDSSD